LRGVWPAVCKLSLGRVLCAVVLCASVPVWAGCLPLRSGPTPTAPQEASPLPVAETLLPEGSAPVLKTAVASPASATRVSAPGAPQTFSVWISDQIGPLAQGLPADVLTQQFVAFEATHPGLTIEVAIKGTEGVGGIENLLTTASAAAPSVLPDLVALSTDRLVKVARQGLTVPLEELIAPEIQDDLYGLAHKATTVDGQWMGVQFQAKGLEHAIYNPNKIAAAPLTWADVFSSGATYVFPAAGQDGLVNDAFLIQYLSTGEALVDDGGRPALDRDALAQVLGFYRQGIERGAILTDVIEYATIEQIWPRFLQAEVVLSNISSDLYLSVKTGQATAVPTRDGQAVILSRGHAWAITARDPDRQRLAAELVEWLLDPINMAAWSQSAGTLPTRRAALLERSRDPYVTFMYSQLETALPFPTSETHLRIYRAMQQAVTAVLREGVSPDVAADGVLQAVNQETSG
jgi:multiple sugar transport system substrate-binding protein